MTNGKLLYSGQSLGAGPVNSMLDLLSGFSEEDLARVSEILFSACGFSRIEGLERLPNLLVLDLLGNSVEELTGLERVPNIEVLNFSQNRIERIDGLDGLQNLRELHLAHNQITHIEGLEGLSKLEVLILVGNEIEEISGVSHLKSLKRLELAGNKLRNIVALRDLPNLQTVSIESSRNQLDEESLRFIEVWNARHADKPSLQLRTGMPAAGGQQEAPVDFEPGAPEPP